MDGFTYGMPSPFLQNNQSGHHRGINPSSDDSYVHD